MAKKDFEIEKFADALSTISEIIWRRINCMECNQCEPCGAAFMGALKTLKEMGTPNIKAASKAGNSARE
jgi:hypothetical protein